MNEEGEGSGKKWKRRVL